MRLRLRNWWHLRPRISLAGSAERELRFWPSTATGTDDIAPRAVATVAAATSVDDVAEKRKWRRPGSNRGPRDYESVRARVRRAGLVAAVDVETLAGQGFPQGP